MVASCLCLSAVGQTVQWDTTGTTAGTANQTGSVNDAAGVVNATLSAPSIDIGGAAGLEQGLFVQDTAAANYHRFNESAAGIGRYLTNFDAPIFNFSAGFGNLGRDISGSGTVGNFEVTTADGSVFTNAIFGTSTINPETGIADSFQIFAAIPQPLAMTSLDFNGDGTAENYIHDATDDGGLNQASGYVDFVDNFNAYGGVTSFSFDQVGDGIGPTGTFAIFGTSVPEPSSAVILAVLPLAAMMRRKRKNKVA